MNRKHTLASLPSSPFISFHDHKQNPNSIHRHNKQTLSFLPSKMSLASIQYIPIPTPSSSTVRFSATKPTILTIRSSAQANGPLRRPSIATPPVPPSPSPTPPPPPQSSAPAAESTVTMEYQRQRAKELQEYFKQKKLEEANQGPFFGFIAKNEISNGRWAMFGFAVGMLTEYATGSDFVDQVKILLSNFGILDLE